MPAGTLLRRLATVPARLLTHDTSVHRCGGIRPRRVGRRQWGLQPRGGRAAQAPGAGITPQAPGIAGQASRHGIAARVRHGVRDALRHHLPLLCHGREFWSR